MKITWMITCVKGFAGTCWNSLTFIPRTSPLMTMLCKEAMGGPYKNLLPKITLEFANSSVNIHLSVMLAGVSDSECPRGVKEEAMGRPCHLCQPQSINRPMIGMLGEVIEVTMKLQFFYSTK